MNEAYQKFLEAKVAAAPRYGFGIESASVSNHLLPHQKVIVPWMVEGGRRALFASFGLGKSVMQLEAVRICSEHERSRGLIVMPLGVRQEFRRDAVDILRWPEPPKFIRSIDEAGATGVYLTNYETIRDGKIDPRHFVAASLDEAAVLRGFGGTKTFREFMRLFAGDGKTLNDRIRSAEVKYRFVATATPSPNDYIELLAYAAYLGIMDVGAAKTRFFKRNSEKADQLTIHPHKAEEFWLWVASWALFVTKPSDMGAEYSDEGYTLPELDVRWHEISSDHRDAGTERDGQGLLFRNVAIGVTNAAKEKRDSLAARIEKLQEIRAEDPQAHLVIWHDLEAEREAIEHALPNVASVYGSQDLDEREQIVIDFSDGRIQELAGKPVMLGSGCNMQRHCWWEVFLGIGFKFKDFIQAVHRCHRFLQTHRVRIDIIYTEAEREVRQTLERKWVQHNEMVDKMTALIREYGLTHASDMSALSRSMGVERVVVCGENYRLVNNDCVLETRRMESNSVDLILTSIPFSSQYEYSPNYSDFGHSDNNAHFFQQMEFLTPELLRVLKPGRIAAIHVKDRIVPGGMTGLGFQVAYPFHCKCIEHYTACPDCRARTIKDTSHVCTHRFAYLGMKTIVTDVVRENNQTYRLGWTEQCKDGSKMGVGMPEYLLLFRKPPTDTTNSYADEPVVKIKPLCRDADGNAVAFDRKLPIIAGSPGYSRSRWQVDAHGFTRSSGNRQITADDLEDMQHDAIFRLFRDFNLENIYDFEHHVRLGEELEAARRLPVTFMLLQPPSWHPDVWTDITRMLTLNGSQSAKGKEMHLCPMQFDLADRAIEQWSMPGEVVYDPFGGLMTVPYRAILKGRKARACELSAPYFLDGAAYCKAAELQVGMPDLFSVLERESDGEAA